MRLRTRATMFLGSAAWLMFGLAARAVPAAHALLDVPYLAQTPELCGGAAAAMVMRYWGDRDVYPEDFRTLVVPAEHGIPAAALLTSIRARHWNAFEPAGVGPARLDVVSAAIDRGQPVIVLLQVTPSLRHYVVVVGVTLASVVLHDPARTPFVVMARQAFDAAWAPAGRWALIVVPAAGTQAVAPIARASVPEVDATTARPTACGDLVTRSVDLASGGAQADASDALETAVALCPGDAAPLRELAGLRLLQHRLDESRDLAARAVAISADDRNAWQVLATARFLGGDTTGALEAWNHVDSPRLDVVQIETDGATRRPVIARLIDLQPRTPVSADAFGRAERRLAELPAAAETLLRLTPTADGRAEVTADVLSRPVAPKSLVPLASLAARAFVLDEATADFSDLAKSGDRWTPMWRWAEGTPRVSLDLAVPSPAPLPGFSSVSVYWDRQSYADPGAGVLRESERGARFSLADWATATTRWEVGGGLTHDVRDRAGLTGALEERAWADRYAVRLSAQAWMPLGGSPGGASFAAGDLSAHWRSTTSRVPAWTVVSGLVVTGDAAPLAFWPGAGTGVARDDLLRAHPLLDAQGVIDGPGFGRRLAYDSVEFERPIARTIAGPIAIAAFVDAAKAWRRLADALPSPWLVDAGVGLRIHATGVAGTIRLDFAHGLRDNAHAFSAGWMLPWPR